MSVVQHLAAALGDLLGWGWEHPWHVAGGVLVWMAVSVAVALVAGPVMAEGVGR